ncbi:hypothetical protein OG985_21105 [Streptomyces sp. NBC_00289]|uniref:hypothetical protein n=1 Tax=Streptomyces sp. NBC_00289 TaxID=2975703 RepID=UPI0032446B15
MGSLRNPVGPLPSTIYWRRRAVLLSVLALLTLLIAWIVTTGGGGGDNGADGSNGKNPAPTITAGPSDSGPAISQAPGGRDESSGGASNGSGSGTGDGSGSGATSGADSGGSGDSGGAGSADGGAGGGSAGGTGGGVGTGDTLPAGSPLPNCTASNVTLTLRSVKNAYAPGQTPAFELTAKNSAASDCKVDLGPKTAVLTITQAGTDDDYWSSADCPKVSGGLVFRVPAGSSITYTVKWDRKPSAPECATPPAGSAGAGTYLVEAKAPAFAKTQTSFVLQND